MKKPVISLFIAAFVVASFSGCVASVGGGSKTTMNQPTVGQQLLDLQKARDAGAISPNEYADQRAKVLGQK